MRDVTTPQPSPEATSDIARDTTTPQPEASRYATVREAADTLGVSAETIRRMIRSGRLRAERVHRPQGTAFLVELPNVAEQAPRDVTGHDTTGRHHATPDQSMTPALLAVEAWTRGVIEPLTRALSEQQQQLVSQAETIGMLRAELAAASARITTLESSPAVVQSEPSTQPVLAPVIDTPHTASWWQRWRSWLAASLVIAVVGSASCQALPAAKHAALCGVMRRYMDALAEPGPQPNVTWSDMRNAVEIAAKVC